MYGQLGLLTYDQLEDKVQCHLCGSWFRCLGVHVFRTHGLAADEYRENFGLNRGQSLICEGTRRKLSVLNKESGNFKHLASQTMTKSELSNFLRSITLKPGYNLREQALAIKSKLLKNSNPMNTPEVMDRKITTLKKTWYGTKRMRGVCRTNLLNTIAKLRKETYGRDAGPVLVGKHSQLTKRPSITAEIVL